MTIEEITARITKLEQDRDQAKNMYIALDGALQEAKYWLSCVQKDNEVKNVEDNTISDQ